MKITIEELPGAELEIILRCPRADEQIRSLANRISALVEGRIAVRAEEETRLLEPEEVLYIEAVEGTAFVYTENAVWPTRLTLSETEGLSEGFFRCSKSMVVNLRRIERLCSGLNGRLIATLANGEKILISRHYAAPIRWALLNG
ncbi:LytTR family transcriptional regulator DNA-binding domain-containing protein [Oscillibacter sp. MSJ-2]|uniref:LytTR family transcriptional regulator DNA-binding domain-containing protein n=1 Tax=Dysosmobacter acutus TaxID=2841504 RepID=A0ABS6F961_9FIRM|nr:LytTR family DNA-binding domain-containing protein [Dysosmobacter acutus]MBU5626821.1 LytTR family transcriptional regulator DNA-binding domain-containing protein [Dysosmobacter acutus]